MSDLECPYCGAENKVNHEDGFGYAQDEAHEMECDMCGKNFVFFTTVHFHYSPRKADCLNGSPHNFGEWKTTWKTSQGEEFQRRYCKDCDHYERREVATEKG